jgi:hypothetical protein
MAIVQCSVCCVGWVSTEPEKHGDKISVPTCESCRGKLPPPRHSITDRPNLPETKENNDPAK